MLGKLFLIVIVEELTGVSIRQEGMFHTSLSKLITVACYTSWWVCIGKQASL